MRILSRKKGAVPNDAAEVTKHFKSLCYFTDADMVGICEMPDYAWYANDTKAVRSRPGINTPSSSSSIRAGTPWRHPMSRHIYGAAFTALALLAACADDTMSRSASDEAAARTACRSEADASKARPEGRGLAGAEAYDKFVEDCMREKGC
jgi:hypothetical protein